MNKIKEIEEDLLPEIDGYNISPREWIAFTQYTATGDSKIAAQSAGITVATLYRWRKTTWWQNLVREVVEVQQDKFYTKLAKYSDEILNAFMAVIRSEESARQTATAIISAVKLYTQMAKGGTEPLVSTKPVIENHKTENNFNISEKNITIIWGKMDNEEREQFHLTGELPNKYKEEITNEQ